MSYRVTAVSKNGFLTTVSFGDYDEAKCFAVAYSRSRYYMNVYIENDHGDIVFDNESVKGYTLSIKEVK